METEPKNSEFARRALTYTYTENGPKHVNNDSVEYLFRPDIPPRVISFRPWFWHSDQPSNPLT